MSQDALISRLNELPRIESVLQELLAMVNRDDFSFAELSQKLAMDQVLSARLLRMANSAYFAETSRSTISMKRLCGLVPRRCALWSPRPSFAARFLR